MKVTVGQWSTTDLEKSWNTLKAYLENNETDMLLLPEMSFSDWFCSLKEFDRQLWDQVVKRSEEWMSRISELNVPIVIGTSPSNRNNSRTNIAWVWDNGKLHLVHEKYYLPDEEGFWEASWYQMGDGSFELVEIKGIKIGFLVCTEMWFMRHTRDYADSGIHFLLCPRATPMETTEKWLLGGQVSGVISGAYCLSSNHEGMALDGKTTLGGVGWVADFEGKILATSDINKKWVTVEVDLKQAELAKTTYPRYVKTEK